MPRVLARKEVLHQRAAFICQDVGLDLYPVIQNLRHADVKVCRHCAEAFVVGSVNESLYTSVNQGTAHIAHGSIVE
jgi:hypothetical protein